AVQVDLLPALGPLALEALAVERVGAVPMVVRAVGARPAVHLEAVAGGIELELEALATARDVFVPATGQRMGLLAAASPGQHSRQCRGDAQLHRRDNTQLVAAAHARRITATTLRFLGPCCTNGDWLPCARPVENRGHGNCARRSA